MTSRSNNRRAYANSDGCHLCYRRAGMPRIYQANNRKVAASELDRWLDDKRTEEAER